MQTAERGRTPISPSAALLRSMTVEPLLSPTTTHRFNTEPVLRFCLQISKGIQQLRQTHARILRAGILRSRLLLLLTSQLLQLPDRLKYARKVFDEIPQCNDSHVWTSIIRAHTLHSQFTESLSLFARMRRCGVPPSPFTLSSVLTATSRLSAIREGREVHTLLVKLGFLSHKVVQTVLLDMYSKCGVLVDARQVFDAMPRRDIVSWTAMVAGYAKAGMMGAARALFDEMSERNVVSWTVMVAGYANCGQLGPAGELFDQMPERNSVTWTAMIAGYGKCGEVHSARRVFDQIPAKDPETFAAMVACYSQNGFPQEAIKLFTEMKAADIEVNEVALVGIISACTQIGDSTVANTVARHIEDRGSSQLSLVTANALIHMHSKCGKIEKAVEVFYQIHEKDVISYTALITGLADHGLAQEALCMFERMREDDIKPNEITFVGVLNACSHAGLVEGGLGYFKLMKGGYRLAPGREHYACLADLFGRAGRLEEAHKLIESNVGVSDAGAWGALLNACVVHCNVAIAEIAAKHLFETEPENTGNYILLANAYASVNRWEDAARVRQMMQGSGVRKSPGYSWASG